MTGDDDKSPQSTTDKKGSKSPSMYEKYNINSAKSINKVDEKIDTVDLDRYVSEFEEGFKEGRFSVRGSKYENKKEAVDSFRNLMQNIGDKEEVMHVMSKFNIQESTGNKDVVSRDPGVVDYDTDEALRRNR